MSDPAGTPLPPPPVHPPAPSPPNRGLGWFFVVSGGIVLVLTLGCMVAMTDGNLFGNNRKAAFVFGAPTLILSAVFLWLGSRRLKR